MWKIFKQSSRFDNHMICLDKFIYKKYVIPSQIVSEINKLIKS